MADGRVDLHFTLYDNAGRTVRYNTGKKHPEDSAYQSEDARISPQIHY
ncbi:MAG: hypothetical protein ACXWT3_01265 [Methylococcaceae bacterium]